MSEQKHQFIGISAFGQRDTVSLGQDEKRSTNYLPSCVILQDFGAAPITGRDAQLDSTQLGLPYPVNSQVDDDDITLDMKRALISLIWKKIISDGSSDERWGNVSCSRLLSLHIASLLNNNFQKDDCLSVAIPNLLNDHAQEHLLLNLSHVLGGNRDQIKLIWRTVAAALYWLDVPNHPYGLKRMYRLNLGLKIGVVYLGLDGIEYSCFEVHDEVFNNRLYLVPKRTLPDDTTRFDIDGFDLFESALDKFRPMYALKHAYAKSEIWQLLNRAEEVWPFMLNLQTDPKERVWYKGGSWVKEKIVTGSPGALGYASACIGELNKKLFNTKFSDFSNSWISSLCGWLKNAHKVGSDTVDALIVTGPLSSAPIARQIAMSLGFSFSDERKNYKPGVWYTDSDDIAGGAAVFSERVFNNAPTYTEEFERLSVFVMQDNDPYYELMGLIDEEIIEQGYPAGNKSYVNMIERKLALARGSSALPVYLAKGNVKKDGRGRIYEDPGLNIISNKVKFGARVKDDVPLITKLEIRPASGYAQISFRASNEAEDIEPALKKWTKFRFDRMDKATWDDIHMAFGAGALPYPPDREFKYYSKREHPYISSTFERGLKNLNLKLNQTIYNTDGIKNLEIKEVFYQKIDKENCYLLDPFGNFLIEIDPKLFDLVYDKFFKAIEPFAKREFFRLLILDENILKTVTLFRARTPKRYRDYIKNYLSACLDRKSAPRTHVFRAASYCFTTEEEIKSFFDFCELYFEPHPEYFRYTFATAYARVLDEIPNAKKWLSPRCALIMIKACNDLMRRCLENENISLSFRASAYLILCTLKCRSAHEDFLSMYGENAQKTNEILNEIKNYIEQGMYSRLKTRLGDKFVRIDIDSKTWIEDLYSSGYINKSDKKTLEYLFDLENDIVSYFESRGNRSALTRYRSDD